jgi:hypothetical protein
VRTASINVDYVAGHLVSMFFLKTNYLTKVLIHSFSDSAYCFLLNLVFILHKEIRKYISTYRLRLIYIVQASSINKLELTIIKYVEIYIMLESDMKVLPMINDVNAEKKAEPSVKKDSSKAV